MIARHESWPTCISWNVRLDQYKRIWRRENRTTSRFYKTPLLTVKYGFKIISVRFSFQITETEPKFRWPQTTKYDYLPLNTITNGQGLYCFSAKRRLCDKFSPHDWRSRSHFPKENRWFVCSTVPSASPPDVSSVRLKRNVQEIHSHLVHDPLIPIRLLPAGQVSAAVDGETEANSVVHLPTCVAIGFAI